MTDSTSLPSAQPATSPDLDVSFVLPARNEELLIEKTLQAIHAAAKTVGIRYEIIVADDDSDDATSEIAVRQGARVVRVKLHNIGAVRNAGAELATGWILFFLDADTILPAKTLKAALQAIEQGAVGGGAAVDVEGITFGQRMLVVGFAFFWQRLRGWAAGCSIFARRDAFEAIGGFNARYFAAEERYLSEALRTQGRFVILREPVITSGRKLRIFSTGYMLKVGWKMLVLKRFQMTSPEGLELLYDAPRETGAEPSSRGESKSC